MSAFEKQSVTLPSLEEFQIKARDYCAYVDRFLDEMQDATQLGKQVRSAVARVAGIDRSEGVSPIVNQMQAARRAEYEAVVEDGLRASLGLAPGDDVDVGLDEADLAEALEIPSYEGGKTGARDRLSGLVRRMTGEKR
jgi:hypothetical protein